LGDRCSKNYRRISLLNTTYKVFTTILRNKLEPLAENIIGEYQAGFRPGKSTTDQSCAVKQVLEGIDREKLYSIMLDFNTTKISKANKTNNGKL